MNPFKNGGYMLPVASINSVFVEDTIASELFSPRLLIDDIDQNRVLLGIKSSVRNHDLLFIFNKLLADKNDLAEQIAYKHALNLSKVLLTLKNPSKLSKKNRKNWSDSHWNFWKYINKIYLVGGLTSTELNSIFSQVIAKEILKQKISDFSVEIITNSSNYGTLGLLKKNANNEVLLFDFGQSFIKRGYTKLINNDFIFENNLSSIKSKFIEHKNYSKCDLKASANTLHKYIVDSIIDTFYISNFKGNLIEISIANYIFEGKIYNSRGGYAKLHLIDENYEEYLTNCISKILNKDIKIRLYHDTTAMSFMFDKNDKEAVISLGTGFGVSFLD